MRLGITAALTDLDVAPDRVAAAVEARGFDSFWVPEHTHLPVREDEPPALVEGVRLDDYKRCLDPVVALSSAAAVTTRIGLVAAVATLYHEPYNIARRFASLDWISAAVEMTKVWDFGAPGLLCASVRPSLVAGEDDGQSRGGGAGDIFYGDAEGLRRDAAGQPGQHQRGVAL